MALNPLRRVLDPRFGDVTHRLAGVAEEVHAAKAQLSALQGAVDGHAEALTEIAVHLGERMDRIESALERIEARLNESR